VDGKISSAPYLNSNNVVDVSIADGEGGWYIAGTFTTVQGANRERLAHILADGSLDTRWNPTVDGTVKTCALLGNTLYIGGSFTAAGGKPRRNLAAIDVATGEVTAWSPGADRHVNSLVATGNIVYAGGVFASIGGQIRSMLAAIDATTGAVLEWNPGVSGDGPVMAMAMTAGTIYVGGNFFGVGGKSRYDLAAIDLATGAVKDWKADLNGMVEALVIRENALYVGGFFAYTQGEDLHNLMAVDLSTGLPTPWRPKISPIAALALNGNTLYAGGRFWSAHGQVRQNLAAFDLRTGELSNWTTGTAWDVYTLAVSDDALFVGGNFNSAGGYPRMGLAAIDATTGRALDWQPRVSTNTDVNALAIAGRTLYVGGNFFTVNGQPRNTLAAIDAVTGDVTDWNPGISGEASRVNAIAVAGSTVYAGGWFPQVGDQPRNSLAAIHAKTGRVSTWNPDVVESPGIAGVVNALTLSGNKLYVGGSFGYIYGQRRDNLAAVDTTTGRASVWAPDVWGEVCAMAFLGNAIYIGGKFSLAGTYSRNNVAALDTTTGIATSWNPGAGKTVRALAIAGNIIYMGGEFMVAGSRSRYFLAAADAVTGKLADWNPEASGMVRALTCQDGRIYAGGQFRHMQRRWTGGFAAFGPKIIDPNYIRGMVYREQNNNCQKDIGEPAMANSIVMASPGDYFASTDSLGRYEIAVDTGGYTVQQVIPAYKTALVQQVCPAGFDAHTIRFTAPGQRVSGINFANQVAIRPNLTISVASSRRRRCASAITSINYTNDGTGQADGVKVYVKLPQHVVFVAASRPYTIDQDKNLVFDVGTLTADAAGSIYLTDSVVCNDPNIRGLTQCTRAWITPSNARTPGPEWDRSDITLNARCGNNGLVRLGIYNTGTGAMTDSSAFRVYLDAQLAFARNLKLGKGDSLILQVPANGRTVRLEADQRPGHPSKQFTSVTLEACGTNAQGGVSLGFVAQLPGDDQEPEVAEQCLPITDSFDPNDKAVSPEGVTDQHYTPTGSRLDYLIRFQNTGTDVAYKVVVTDTLSEHLDVSTLQVGSVSHAYKMQVSGKGRPVLTFTFNNILLPDSNANEPKSHGYLQFSIKPKAGLPEKTRIENLADIFFDYNEPVRTNTTFNTLYDLPPVVAEAVKLQSDVVCTPTNLTATAGSNRTVCGQDTVRLAALQPTGGTGRWQAVGGTAQVSDPTNPTTRVSRLAYGENVFEWRVAANSCGTDSLAGRLTVTRLSPPAAPTITQRGADSLTCSVAATGYAWYFEGSPLGLHTRTIGVSRPGKYTVRLKEEGDCYSQPSAAFPWLPTASEPGLAGLLRVYPNPTTGAFVVVLPPDLGGPVLLSLHDARGRVLVVRALGAATRTEAGIRFDLSAGPKGVYLLKVQTAQGVLVRKVCKQ
jgi:uncharacterized repeat protein (TIGR01451 family)